MYILVPSESVQFYYQVNLICRAWLHKKNLKINDLLLLLLHSGECFHRVMVFPVLFSPSLPDFPMMAWEKIPQMQTREWLCNQAQKSKEQVIT